MSEERMARSSHWRQSAKKTNHATPNAQPRAQAIGPDDVRQRDIDIAHRAGRMVEMRIARGEFQAAIAAVLAAQRDYYEDRKSFVPEKLSVAELGLDVRTVNMLERAGIHTAGQLAARSDADLLGIASFGQIALSKIRVCLEAIGLYAAPSLAPAEGGPRP